MCQYWHRIIFTFQSFSENWNKYICTRLVTGFWSTCSALQSVSLECLNLIIQLELISNTFSVSLPVFMHPWSGVSNALLPRHVWRNSDSELKNDTWTELISILVRWPQCLLQLRWAYWDMLPRWGRENWTHPCSVFTQNVLGRNVGWFVRGGSGFFFLFVCLFFGFGVLLVSWCGVRGIIFLPGCYFLLWCSVQ